VSTRRAAAFEAFARARAPSGCRTAVRLADDFRHRRTVNPRRRIPLAQTIGPPGQTAPGRVVGPARGAGPRAPPRSRRLAPAGVQSCRRRSPKAPRSPPSPPAPPTLPPRWPAVLGRSMRPWSPSRFSATTRAEPRPHVGGGPTATGRPRPFPAALW
jgi:hypothetical protein